MAQAVINHVYPFPKTDVFKIFADIGAVQDISPGIESSKRLNKKQGKGGVRECDFGKGAGIHEEVTAFTKDQQIQFTGIKFWGAPLKEMVATFDFQEVDRKTTVNCVMDFDMKLGFLLNPIAKGQMRKSIKAMLVGADNKLSA
jgi:hypothetical protein